MKKPSATTEQNSYQNTDSINNAATQVTGKLHNSLRKSRFLKMISLIYTILP